MKACTKCKNTKELDSFPKDRRRKDGRGSWCRRCAREASKTSSKKSGHYKQRTLEYRTKNRAKLTADRRTYEQANAASIALRKRQGRLKTYGITIAEYERMFEAQNGVCAICNEFRVRKQGENLAVDHCHETGRVRSLLCYGCNVAIGLLREDPTLLRNAALYLESHPKS